MKADLRKREDQSRKKPRERMADELSRYQHDGEKVQSERDQRQMQNHKRIDGHAKHVADAGKKDGRQRVRREVADIHAGGVKIGRPAVECRRVPPCELVKIQQRENIEIEERPDEL